MNGHSSSAIMSSTNVSGVFGSASGPTGNSFASTPAANPSSTASTPIATVPTPASSFATLAVTSPPSNNGAPQHQPPASTSAQNFSSLVSTILKTTGKEPPPLVGPSTTIVGDVLYVFGGRILSRSRPQLTNDMYALDLITRVWRKPETKGALPPPRYFHSMCALGDAKLVCFGGMSPMNPASPPSTATAGGTAEGAAGVGGAGAAAVAATAQENEVMVMSDVHIFDIPTSTWSYIPTANPPEGRYAHCATILPTTAFFTSASASAAAAGSDGIGGAEMVVVGGQDAHNHYIEQINVFNLRNLIWTHKTPLDRLCGAYRSVIAPLGPSLAVEHIGAGAADPAPPSTNPEEVQPKENKEPSAMLIYSNYNFLDVKLELQVRLPSGELVEKTMNGPHSPPGLRFPNGGVLDNHFVVSGTYLTSSKQEYALWALDLRTLIWSRIDAGQLFAQGSWNRGVLWPRRSSFLIIGSRGRSLVEDYNHRRINFSNLCKVDLEAFGLYENWRAHASSRVFSPAAQEFGRTLMAMADLTDMEFVSMEGESVPVNSRVVGKRWGRYFIELLNASRDEDSPEGTATTGNTNNNAPNNKQVATTAQYNPLDRPRALYFPHSLAVLQTLVEFLYTGTLPPPGEPGVIAPVLCSLLQIARPYRIEGLLEATVDRIHQQLDGKNAAAVFNAAATAAGSGSGVRAVYNDGKEGMEEAEEKEEPLLLGGNAQEMWWEGISILGLQKRGLRGLMEGRRMRERGRSVGAGGLAAPGRLPEAVGQGGSSGAPA